MSKFKCSMCGYIYDSDVDFNSLGDDWVCPLCGAKKSYFEVMEEVEKVENNEDDLDKCKNNSNIAYLEDIHYMARNNKSVMTSMGSLIPSVNFDDILIMGCQLGRMPLFENEDVSLRTVIGKKALKPMVIESPVYVSHMSFGALSREAKIAIAKGSAMAMTAVGSGEGGILEEERNNAYKYIFEIIPNMYSVNDENLKNCDAIEIKIGQSVKPGMGGFLPASKVTEEIAFVRGKEVGVDIESPSKFRDIITRDDLKKFVDELRERSEGRAIGIKLAAGRIEEDLEFACYANPDFITIDGRGGATGSCLKVVRDSCSVPTVYALARARKYLDEHNLSIDLVITGGFRTSSDVVKALSMGADAVCMSTAVMMAIGCCQFRICHTGMCPAGIATQDDKLRCRFDIDKSSLWLYNYFNVLNEEIRTFGRICGHRDIHDLSIDDIACVNREISDYTNISHV